jgi:hypothetical protein
MVIAMTAFHSTDSCSLGENGYVGGDAVFRDQSTNSRGYVNGNAIFHEQSYNYGTINGNATVYYDNNQGTYPIGGTVNGTVSYLGGRRNSSNTSTIKHLVAAMMAIGRT